ncbi:MAG TPA: hypothetical protein VJI12_01190, partial [archaeon]|nr:hypothetical protein [archaeon]
MTSFFRESDVSQNESGEKKMTPKISFHKTACASLHTEHTHPTSSIRLSLIAMMLIGLFTL